MSTMLTILFALALLVGAVMIDLGIKYDHMPTSEVGLTVAAVALLTMFFLGRLGVL